MPKKANKSMRPKDKYYQLAKEQGYRARSAFKLIQLNKKYDFLANAHVCIDLCAAPGGWLQVAAKYMPSGSTIIGVDLMPIKPIRGVITHQEDITTPECRGVLKRDMSGKLNWNKDAFTQSDLVLCSLKLATEFLRPKGMFITKIFRSADYNSLLWVFHQLFGKVEATKPHSSRNASAEIFVVCRDYKAPDKIDPKLLDARYVFQEAEDTVGTSIGVAGGGGANTLSVLDKKSAQHNKRQRDGYDTSLGPLLTHAVSATAFIRSDNPVRLLTDASRFDFDEQCKAAGVLAHAATSVDVRESCADLKVLGKKEFKALLKWRHAMRKAFPQLLGEATEEVELSDGEEAGSDEDEEDSETDEDEADMKELSAAARDELRRRKKEKKKLAEKRAKAVRRQRLGMNLRSVDMLNTDNSLFSLEAIKRLAGRAAAAGAGDGDVLDSIIDIDDAADENTRLFANPSLMDEDGDAATGARLADMAGHLGAHDFDDEDAEDLDDGVAGIASNLKSRAASARLDDMEEDFDRAYAQYLAKKEQREAIMKAQAEKGETASKGIKLSRMQKLKQQAVLTEAALTGQLEAEHQRYVKLLAGVRNAAGQAAVAGEANGAVGVQAVSGVKRKRDASAAVASDGEDENDSDGESEYASEADEVDGDIDMTARAPGQNRWFSNPIFADMEQEEGGLGLPASVARRAIAAEADGSSDSDDDDNTGWLAQLPKSDRDKRKDKLRKARDKASKIAEKAKAEREGIEVVAGVGGDIDDAEAQFQRVLRSARGEILSEEEDDDSSSDESDAAKKELIRRGMGRAIKGAPAVAEDGDIEIVPANGKPKRDGIVRDDDGESTETDSDGEESDDPRMLNYDSDTHAEMLALGKMLKKHTTAKALLDASYNRYAFDDSDLPAWFEADESRHFRPQLPVSKAEVETIKAKFRDIAARPVAKVAEARARKRRRMEVTLAKAKKQAESVMESEELQGRSREKALAKIYRGQAVRRPTNVMVVAKRSGSHGNAASKAKRGGGRVKLVDPRFKKDARAMKRRSTATAGPRRSRS